MTNQQNTTNLKRFLEMKDSLRKTKETTLKSTRLLDIIQLTEPDILDENTVSFYIPIEFDPGLVFTNMQYIAESWHEDYINLYCYYNQTNGKTCLEITYRDNEAHSTEDFEISVKMTGEQTKKLAAMAKNEIIKQDITFDCDCDAALSSPIGFNAMGKPISHKRRQTAYNTCREIGFDKETAASIVNTIADSLERDEPFDAIERGLKNVDITGVYRIIAVLLTA